MSFEPVDSDTVGDKGASIVELMSASYPVDYVMNVRLETKDGSDIPLYNKKLKLRDEGRRDHLSIERQDGTLADEFDYTKEDYWLFHVHLNDASIKIAIGGETAVVVNSNPNWKNITEKDEKYLKLENTWGNVFDLTYEFGSYGTNRFIAVRCPKMDNPAISATVTGNYGGLHWVGLFAKTSAVNTNNFVALRTTNRLLPKYAARTKEYAGYQNWYSEDGAVNLKDVYITLFPKRLFGTSGNSGKLYDQFVTDSPDIKSVQNTLNTPN